MQACSALPHIQLRITNADQGGMTINSDFVTFRNIKLDVTKPRWGVLAPPCCSSRLLDSVPMVPLHHDANMRRWMWLHPAGALELLAPVCCCCTATIPCNHPWISVMTPPAGRARRRPRAPTATTACGPPPAATCSSRSEALVQVSLLHRCSNRCIKFVTLHDSCSVHVVVTASTAASPGPPRVVCDLTPVSVPTSASACMPSVPDGLQIQV